MKFSIIVVTLNPGDKLQDTINSISSQTFKDYEILVKDGGSKDGSLKALEGVEKVRLVENPDKSIYDGMNQAVREAKGDYYIFMNAGDLLLGCSPLINGPRINKVRRQMFMGGLWAMGAISIWSFFARFTGQGQYLTGIVNGYMGVFCLSSFVQLVGENPH